MGQLLHILFISNHNAIMRYDIDVTPMLGYNTSSQISQDISVTFSDSRSQIILEALEILSFKVIYFILLLFPNLFIEAYKCFSNVCIDTISF